MFVMQDDSTSGIPQEILERYTVEELLGRGGGALVFRARRNSDKTQVALKTFGSRYATDLDLRRRVKREVETLERLSHPNMVNIIESSLGTERACLVLDYFAGSTLLDALRGHGAFTVEDTLRLGLDVAGALGHCHESQIIHRDVKPGNIQIESKSGRAILLDFGVVKSLDQTAITRGPSLTGSLGYLTPEQIRGRDVDPRTDIYQLGVVLLQTLSGRNLLDDLIQRLFEHPERMEDLGNWWNLPTIRDTVTDLPTSVENLILNCIQFEPDHRYSSTGEFEDHVRRIQHGEFVSILTDA